MKNKNTIIKIFFVFITLGLFLYANATDINLSIKEIKKVWENTLNITFDTAMPDNWLSWEMKVFKDLWISSVSKDEKASNKIKVSLDKEIKIWSTYNIFSVFWVEWSADFIVEDSLNVKIISQATEAQGISKITIKDKKVLEVEFKSPLNWNEFEFKLLEDLNVSEINSNSWKLVLNTTSPVENNNDYILIMITLTDKSNNNYLLNESIYDFNIWDIKLNTPSDPEPTEDLNSAWNEIVKVDIKVWSWIEIVNKDLKTWTWNLQTWSLWNWTWSQLNIEKVAVKAKTTPYTGPETWLLMILTLIINSIYFLTRKFSH